MKKASGDNQDEGGLTSDTLRAQLEGMNLLLKKLLDNVLILLTGSALKLLPPYGFREQEEGKPPGTGENIGSPEASNTKAALPGKVHIKDTSKDGLLWWRT